MAVTLHQLVLDAANRCPDGDAVRCDGEGLSWSELAQRSHGLARGLIDAGLERGDRVAVLLAKSLKVPIAFYGVFAAGGALVPVDPKAPLSQVARILRSTGARCLVTESGRERDVDELLNSCPELDHVVGPETIASSRSVPHTPWSAVATFASDQAPSIALGGLDTSYIQHTSGSTGEPKLIRHTHASALAFAEWAANEYGLSPADRLTNHSSHHTCFATFDYYAAARAAATTVVLTPAAMMMPASLAELLEREAVSVWYSVPTALVQLLLRGNLEARDLSALRWILFAGETFPDKHLAALMRQVPAARFSHVYGSTEVNVCTVFHLAQGEPAPSPLPIGRACANDRTLVVDEDGKPVGDGDTGELLISGSSVMSGYWGDSERNREALVHRPAPGGLEETWYRTGDRVKTLADGNLTFAGRSDLQVKVRGYRVELEEVEHALLGLDPIEQAAAWAVPDPDGGATIAAAVVIAPESDSNQRQILDALRESLPAYAVPATLDLLPSLPRTPTGKVDRRSLAAKARKSEHHD